MAGYLVHSRSKETVSEIRLQKKKTNSSLKSIVSEYFSIYNIIHSLLSFMIHSQIDFLKPEQKSFLNEEKTN